MLKYGARYHSVGFADIQYHFGTLLLVLCCLFHPITVHAEPFNPVGWKFVREVQIPFSAEEGVVGFAIESDLMDKSKSDLMDLRLVDSSGNLVPLTITDMIETEDPPPFSAQIQRVSRKPGKGTELFIDKRGKVLTRGMTIQTPSRDFVRKVEVRGSDGGPESFVICLDGLIFDRGGSVPLRSLDLFYPVNNFRYLLIRILDDDQAPLKIDGVLLHPPAGPLSGTRAMEARVLENRKNASDGSTTIIADLSERRLPVTRLRIASRTGNFVKRAKLFGAASESPEHWQLVHEWTIFRLREGDAGKENLGAQFSPQTWRFLKLEVTGDGPLVDVQSVEAVAAVRLAIFEFRRGGEYRLYYGNPKAGPSPAPSPSRSINVTRVYSASAAVTLGEEQKNIASTSPRPMTAKKDRESKTGWKVVGMGMLFVGLLLLFVFMLRARSSRRADRRGRPPFIRTKI